MLIPTDFREKLPRGWAYPIGAEAVSAVVGDMPQADDVKLRFAVHKPPVKRAKHSGSNWKGQPLLLAEYRYHLASPGSPKRPFWESWHSPRWEIGVFAVESGNATYVRGLLLEEGLPSHVRPWLATNWKEHGRELCLGLRLSLGVDGKLQANMESSGISARS